MKSLDSWSDLPPDTHTRTRTHTPPPHTHTHTQTHPMGETGGHKIADLVFLPLISFILVRFTTPPPLPYGSNCSHKIAKFVFLPYIYFSLASTALECIKRYWETLCEESR